MSRKISISEQLRAEAANREAHITAGSMRTEFRRIFIVAVILLVAEAAILLVNGKKLLVVFQNKYGAVTEADVQASLEDPEIADVVKLRVTDKWVFLLLKGQKPGTTALTVQMPKVRNVSFVRSGALGLLDQYTGNFSGWVSLAAMVTALLIYGAVVFLRGFRRSCREDLFSYVTIKKLGLFIFLLVLSVLGIICLIYYLVDPTWLFFSSLLDASNKALLLFSLLTAPLILLFAAMICISNLALIRHEGFRTVNLLGFLLAFLILLGLGSGLFLEFRNFAAFNATIAYSTIMSCYYGIYVYFECLLVAVFVVFSRIRKREPAYDKDCIVILGCTIRGDGTLYPLVRGRVDRAIAFSEAQVEHGGPVPIFIPSGGQGGNEPMSEGEAMGKYLLEQGVPVERILPETESVNTLENMRFSRKIAEAAVPEAKVVFSTTNYHVFRSGILARKAGWNPDGIGSNTKWYFWPNALLREFVGMVVDDRRGLGRFLVVVLVYSLAMSILTH